MQYRNQNIQGYKLQKNLPKKTLLHEQAANKHDNLADKLQLRQHYILENQNYSKEQVKQNEAIATWPEC